MSYRATVGCLSPGTSYQLSVSSLGPGNTESPRVVTGVRTAEDKDHAPSVVAVVVLGRHELQINWGAPVAPLGRLFRYELSLNGCVVYLGPERSYTAYRLSANTAYTCVVKPSPPGGAVKAVRSQRRQRGMNFCTYIGNFFIEKPITPVPARRVVGP